MEFRLLGEVEALLDGRRVDIGHARQRCVLGGAAGRGNRPVPVDQLIDRVWADRPPHRARNALSGYLSRLRQQLAAASDVRIEPGARRLPAVGRPARGGPAPVPAARPAGPRGRPGPPPRPTGLRAGPRAVARGAVRRPSTPRGSRAPHRAAGRAARRRAGPQRRGAAAPAGTRSCWPSWPPRCARTRWTSGWPASSCSPSSAAAGRPTPWTATSRSGSGCATSWARIPAPRCARCTSGSWPATPAARRSGGPASPTPPGRPATGPAPPPAIPAPAARPVGARPNRCAGSTSCAPPTPGGSRWSAARPGWASRRWSRRSPRGPGRGCGCCSGPATRC